MQILPKEHKLQWCFSGGAHESLLIVGSIGLKTIHEYGIDFDL
jgi:hypothetical protein